MSAFGGHLESPPNLGLEAQIAHEATNLVAADPVPLRTQLSKHPAGAITGSGQLEYGFDSGLEHRISDTVSRSIIVALQIIIKST